MDLSEFPDHNIIHFPNYKKFGKQIKYFLTFPPFGKPISDRGCSPLKGCKGDTLSIPPPSKKGVVPLPGETPLPEVVRFSVI
jgi:hypothetical protein